MLGNAAKIEGLIVAQFQSFATKMPAFYLAIAVMMAGVSYTFVGTAPAWLALGVPACFFVSAVSRGYWWWQRRAFLPLEHEAQQHLRRATAGLVIAVAAVVAMDVALFSWGDLPQRYFILLHLLFIAVAGFFCLMHLRLAAAAVAITVVIPAIVMCCILGRPGDYATSLDAGVMAGMMILTMMGYQRDFLHLVRSKNETIRLSRENLRLANTDTLTGLQNRRQFFDALQAKFHDPSHLSSECFAVGLMDLDGFKPVNDTHGHAVGDAVLAAVASRLMLHSNAIVHLCRVGGDEFAFIVPGLRDEDALLKLGQGLIDAVCRPIQVDDLLTSVGCSIGFAVYPDVAESADLLYERADYALYHAKRSGRARPVLFSDEHQRLIREQGAIEQTLRRADLEAEFYPAFQPIVDSASGRTMGFECLARWSSPTLGDVSPSVFIPVAEQAGIIGNLTPVILRKALEAAREWPEDIHLSFNASPYDIANVDCITTIIRLITESKVDPHRIAMEITESALLHNFAQANSHIAMLSDIGVMISLDDFGTGYSSLSYLHALKFDKIKIDRSFIRDIQTNPASKNIVRSVIALCRDMRLSCVVEGVETDEQLQIVQQLGGNVIQGFLFSRPISAEKACDYLSEERDALQDA